MLQSTVLLAFAFLTICVFPQPSLAFRTVAVGSDAPPLSVRSLEGKEGKISFGRRLVVLTFWRPNQSFSLDALRDLEQIAKEFSQQGVEIFAVAEGRSASPSVQKALKGLSLSFPVYMDPQQKAEERYGVIVFPATGIIGTDGRLKFYLPSRNSNFRKIVRGRLNVELGSVTEKEFQQQMEQIGEELGGERLRAEEHLRVGIRLSRQGKDQEALQELKQALALDPELTDTHLALGYSYLDGGEIETAQKEFKKVLERHPTSPGARVGMGIVEVRFGRLDRGIAMLEEAVGLNPDPVRGYYELGAAYEKKGDFKKALHAYKWAVKKLLQGRR